ncbi:MAG: septum formation inhibitor Maf [Bacteroidia bacterium]|nr:septum formation inhibitor Maf [Bacteroidia bacterium]NNK60993.1 septum formation inhibitor Maf [Flavobacteriaceae bacterium]
MKNMKALNLTVSRYGFLLGLAFAITSCDQTQSPEMASNLENSPEYAEANEPSQAFKDYWYAGVAEITSFELEQARYGELRNGNAVLIYVTEDFRPEAQVKADRSYADNISVLKLNATKTFNTGIYPYSIMQSTFYPVSNDQHALKVSSSIQEWCGHVYSQLNNRDQFEIDSHSYFESEADADFKLDKAILENEIWTQLRIDPASLPQGDMMIIPSLEFIRLRHIELKAYKAIATLSEGIYTLDYPNLDRSLSISFKTEFPYEIQGWTETFNSGFGPNAKTMTTTAKKLESITSAYWSKNSNADEGLRKTLGL